MSIDKYLTPEDLQDMGLYLRGLIQIMAADDHIHREQKTRIRDFAKNMGYESSFIENIFDSIKENKHITKEPSKFHSKSTALAFLKEASEIAICDGFLHPGEKSWLLQAASLNNIDSSVIHNIINTVPESVEVPD